MDDKAHIKTELEIIESYLPWKEYMDRNEMPKHIEADVYAKAESKWVSLEWLKEQLVVLDINLSSASNRVIPLFVDGEKEMHRGFLTYNEVDDMIRELKTLLEG